MPKMKTRSGAKKRFIVNAGGKIKIKRAFTSHMMINKPKSMKRKVRGHDYMHESDEQRVLNNFLPYAIKKRGKRSPSPAERQALKAQKAAEAAIVAERLAKSLAKKAASGTVEKAAPKVAAKTPAKAAPKAATAETVKKPAAPKKAAAKKEEGAK